MKTFTFKTRTIFYCLQINLIKDTVINYKEHSVNSYKTDIK
jgi:hypothetical protein